MKSASLENVAPPEVGLFGELGHDKVGYPGELGPAEVNLLGKNNTREIISFFLPVPFQGLSEGLLVLVGVFGV